jgi:hypothetical protein
MAGSTEIGPGSSAPFLELCATGILVAGAKVLVVHRNPPDRRIPMWGICRVVTCRQAKGRRRLLSVTSQRSWAS